MGKVKNKPNFKGQSVIYSPQLILCCLYDEIKKNIKTEQ